MIATVLSPHYALVMADRLVTIPPIDFQLGGINLKLKVPTPPFQKIFASTDRMSVIAVAGSLPFHGTYVDDVINLGGFQVDEAIAARYLAHANFKDFPTMPAGQFSPEESFHVYRASGRFIICIQSVSPLNYLRLHQRNFWEELFHVVIGSGKSVADRLLEQEPFKSEWAALVPQVEMDVFDNVFRFWKRMFRAVSEREQSVGSQTISARMTTEDPVWKTFDGTIWRPIPQE